MSVTGVKFTELPEAEALEGDEVVAIVQAGGSARTTVQDIANLGGGGPEFSFKGVASEGVTGTEDDWGPDLTNISRIEVTPGAAAEITGMQGGTDGRVIIITVIPTEHNLILRSQNIGSAAENRFALNGDLILTGGTSVMLMYSETLERWSSLSSI